jgi:bifunctional non-homologous end joining protein LigD
MPLEEYRRKRDFARTNEPTGGAPYSSGHGDAPHGPRRFVVHRHRARRLHYDLRLEVDGVLASWAVPRGPTRDPAVRRMAIHVEDHPLEYFDFEGIIPDGQYGAGDVIVWDWGTWEPEAQTSDPAAAIRAGELKFQLHGQKLAGRFVLVRTGGAPGPEQWLLIHKRDAHAVDGWDAERHPRSVLSGLTNDEVRADEPALWVAQQPADRARIDLSAAAEATLPRFVEPMRATLVRKAFDDDRWLFEVKWDGFRVEAIIDGADVALRTRNGNDATGYFPDLLGPPTWIEAREAVVDGEVVALDPQGRPDFGLLQQRLGRTGAGVVFEAFDLLHLDGRSLLDVPLEQRRKLLALVLRDDPRVRCAGHVVGEGRAFLQAAAAARLEGIVAKRRDSRYQPGQRSPDWLKIKIRPEQDLVVGGWTPPRGRASGLGALVVGVYDGARLRYAGKVGSGFTERARADLLSALEPLRVDVPAFDPAPAADRRGRWGSDLAGVAWVRPDVVIRAELGGWSRDGLVRQAAFKGVDPGRDPRTTTREVPAEAPAETPDPGPGPATTDGPPPGDRTAAGRNAGSAALPDEAWEEFRSLAAGGTWHVGGQALRLTNLDKVLFPPRPGGGNPIRKRELIEYFARIAPAMLPHLAGRPLNLQRFPNGVGQPGFWQKALPTSAPAWLRRWQEPAPRDRAARSPNAHLVADGVAALVWLANQAAFEVHPWTSTCADPDRPTFALVDIDPGTATTWEETLTLAGLFRTALEHLGVRGLPKTTGSRGIQVWIPLRRGRYTFEQTSAWVHSLSRAVASAVPGLVSWEWARAGRGGRARLDYTQNAPGRTLVAPYAVRPAPGAPVSMPISWDELADPGVAPDRWTIREAVARVAERGELFAAAQELEQDLPVL